MSLDLACIPSAILEVLVRSICGVSRGDLGVIGVTEIPQIVIAGDCGACAVRMRGRRVDVDIRKVVAYAHGLTVSDLAFGAHVLALSSDPRHLFDTRGAIERHSAEVRCTRKFRARNHLRPSRRQRAPYDFTGRIEDMVTLCKRLTDCFCGITDAPPVVQRSFERVGYSLSLAVE